MHRQKRSNDAVHWYMSELTSRIVAESGIPSDRFHLGKIILQSLKDAPEFVLQIDGATGKSETNKSVLKRSVQCANMFKALGLKKGDVIVLMAPNHLDLAVPYYAALYLGMVVAPVDKTLTSNELQDTFGVIQPRMIFCQNEKAPDVKNTVNSLDLAAEIVTFDAGNDFKTFPELLQKYEANVAEADFKPVDFDPSDTLAFLIATSGTTGLPKSAAVSHKNFAIGSHYYWIRHNEFPTPSKMFFVLSPLQWISAIINFNLSPVLRFTRLQSSLPLTQEHAYDLINKYKPTFTLCSPTFMSTLFKPGDSDRCDFTCFEFIGLGGSAVPAELLQIIRKVTPNTDVYNLYGLTEFTTFVFHADQQPLGSSGKPMGHVQLRLVDIETEEDIVNPHTPGELWLKGPTVCKGYYNNPEATKETFAEDSWFKTGDMMYRDENWNFYFVERIKLLLKYRNHQVSPVEVETVIRKHPGVYDVAVTGIPDPELGDLIVACVVPRPDCKPTAQEIKDLVKDTLSDTKQLRGGVIFLQEIPMTASTKVHRRKLKEMVLQMTRE